jgi:hypothetical protein
MEPDQPNFAEQDFVEQTIREAEYILERIDKWLADDGD